MSDVSVFTIRDAARALAALAGAVLLALCAAGSAEAQDAEGALIVGVHESPPFVMEDGEGGYSGLAVDLWESMAGELGDGFEYRSYPTVRALIDATETGEVDVAVTNLTITEARTARIDFTQPWFDSGLRIMVNDDGGASFANVFAGLRDSGFLQAYAWLAFAILVASLGYTLFDRKFDKDFPKAWLDGLAESFYTVMTIATSGKPVKRKNLFGWVGRVWQGLWLVFGIMVVAFVTSSVTSVMTALAIKGGISSVADLNGRTVAVVDGSTAEDYAAAVGFDHLTFDNVAHSAQALLNGEVDAVIGDKPVLEYYAHSHPGDPLSVVGAVFNPDKYGFGLPRNSPLRKRMTIEVVGAREEGLLRELSIAYFGKNP